MFPDSPPLVAVPTHLSDDAAAEILDFLYHLTRAFEYYYAAQIQRHNHDIRQSNPPLDQDPPF